MLITDFGSTDSKLRYPLKDSLNLGRCFDDCPSMIVRRYKKAKMVLLTSTASLHEMKMLLAFII